MPWASIRCVQFSRRFNTIQNMDAKHTPGPWEMSGPTLKGNGYNIGSVNSHRTTEGEANAALIAAAPEMLEALEAIATHFDTPASGRLCNISDLLNDARAAIAKAKGQK